MEDKKSLAGTKIKAVPKPKADIGIDTKNTFANMIIDGMDNNVTDIGKLQNFLSIAQNREGIYTLIDAMSEDSMIAAILETYAEDICETNPDGKIVWVESQDEELTKYVQFLLDSLKIDSKIFSWVISLVKYGDTYIKLYRDSDFAEDDVISSLLDTKEKSNQLNEALDIQEELNERIKNIVGKEDIELQEKDSEGKLLKEDLVVHLNSPEDHITNYISKIDNPAEMFELTKKGKTYAYIQAPTHISNKQNEFSNFNYTFKNKDINIHPATSMVHMCLEDNSSRTPEEVTLMNGDDEENAQTFTVKRGQSLLANVFKVWKELELLENSILLNRITKSSVVRAIQVEVGDMNKNQIRKTLERLKQMIEQKSSLNSNLKMSEYINPGANENTIFIPVKNGQGAITISDIGSTDADIKNIADLDYFQNELFGSLRIPKQYFGQTDDNAGFSGGESLAIISSRYGKAIKRMQKTVCQTITDIINLILIDRKRYKDINNFTIKMQAPTTQEEIDRREATSNQIRNVEDIMRIINDNVDDEMIRLKTLKSLLSQTVSDPEIISLLEDKIQKMEESEESEIDEIPEEEETTSTPSRIDTGSESEMPDMNMEETANEEETLPTPEQAMNGEEEGEFEESLELPTFEALGVNGLGE